MNKYLVAIFLLLSIIPFVSITQIQSPYTTFSPKLSSAGNTTKHKQPNKAQLLKHLKNVRFTLQKHLKTMHDNWERGLMYSEQSGLPEDTEEGMALIFCGKLNEDFYKNSILLQQKLSELVTPAFNFICKNIRPLNIDEISHHLRSYIASTFDKDATRQLQTLFQSLYNKHYQICRNSNPNIRLTQIPPVDELFEQCLWFILGTNDLCIYESKVLLHKLDAKIKELEQA